MITTLTLFQGIVLGFVQGLTEFLPISSTAHVQLMTYWGFGATQEDNLLLQAVVNLGTLIAIIGFLRKRIAAMVGQFILSPFSLKKPEVRLSYQVVLATIPAVFVGLFAKDFIENLLHSPKDATFVMGVNSILFAFLLAFAYARDKEKHALTQLTFTWAIVIGVGQALALIPGVSRSGITLTFALFAGLMRKEAAEFSFLLSIPVILGAIVLIFLDEGLSLFQQIPAAAFLPYVGAFFASLLSAWLCVWGFVHLLSKVGLYPFVVYRILLGALILFLLYS